MSETVWKFPLAIADVQRVVMPEGAEALFVAVQDSVLCLWVTVDPTRDPEPRLIFVSGTGNPCPNYARHIGSALMGPFVWHVWESTA